MTMKLGTGFTKIVLQTSLKFFRVFLYGSKSLSNLIFSLKSLVSEFLKPNLSKILLKIFIDVSEAVTLKSATGSIFSVGRISGFRLGPRPKFNRL